MFAYRETLLHNHILRFTPLTCMLYRWTLQLPELWTWTQRPQRL